MDRHTGPSGEPLYVDETDGEIGSKDPFFVVYSDSEGQARWGYFCSNCDCFDTAMDSMGRIKCNACHNVKMADEWDAAHE